MKMGKNTKVCGTCKKEFPKTDEFFFKRIIRDKNKRGDIVEYNSFKSDCKSCHADKGNKRRVKKRCEEMGCHVKDYKVNWIEQMRMAKAKYPEIMHLPEGVRKTIRKWIDNGYNFTTYEQYKVDCKKSMQERALKRRKYNYEKKGTLSDKDRNDMAHQMIAKSRVALVLGLPTSELPDSIYRVVKTNLQIKRELGLTHSTIKNRNINNKYQKQWKQKGT